MSKSQRHSTYAGPTTDRPVLSGDLPADSEVGMGDLTEALETDLADDTIVIDPFPCLLYCPY